MSRVPDFPSSTVSHGFNIHCSHLHCMSCRRCYGHWRPSCTFGGATGLSSWRPFSSFSGAGYTSMSNVGHVPRSLRVKRLSLASPSFAEIPSQQRASQPITLGQYDTRWQMSHCVLMATSSRYSTGRCCRSLYQEDCLSHTRCMR